MYLINLIIVADYYVLPLIFRVICNVFFFKVNSTC